MGLGNARCSCQRVKAGGHITYTHECPKGDVQTLERSRPLPSTNKNSSILATLENLTTQKTDSSLNFSVYEPLYAVSSTKNMKPDPKHQLIGFIASQNQEKTRNL